MKILKKLIILFFILTLFAGGSLYFYVKKQINPVKIKKIIIQEVTKALPRTIATIDKIEYTMGFKIKFNIKKFDLKLKQNNKTFPLISLANTSVSIPIFSMILGSGKAKISLFKPVIELLSVGKASNWQLAMPKNKSVILKPYDKKDKSLNKLVIPTFLLGNSLSFEILNSKIKYNLGKENVGQFNIDRFLIKNLNFKSNTAFEVDSNVKIRKKRSISSFSIFALGEVNLKELIFNKEQSNINIRLKIRNIKNKNITTIALIDNKINLNTDVSFKNVNIKTQTSFLRSTVNSNITLKGKQIKLSSLNTKIYIDDLLKIGKLDFPDYKNLALQLNGSARINDSKVNNINLKWGILPKLSLTSNCIGKIDILSHGTISTNTIKLKNEFNFLSGNLFSDLSVDYDVQKLSNPLRLIRGVELNIHSTGLAFKNRFVDNCLSKNTKIDKTKVSSKTSYAKYIAMVPMLPKTNIVANFSKLKLGSHEANLSSNIKIDNKRIKVKTLHFKSNKSIFKFSGSSYISNKSLLSNYNSQMINFNINILEFLLPSPFYGLNGALQSKSIIKSKITNNINYNILNKTKIKNFSLEGLDIESYKQKALKFVSKPPVLKNIIKKFSPKTKFLSLNSNIYVTEKEIKLKKINIKEFSGKYNITSHGVVNIKKMMTRSKVYLNLFDTSNTDLNTKWLLKLLPDYNFTMREFVKSKIKNETKKIKRKYKKRFEKEKKKQIKKLEKDAGKKLKKLFKGLF